MQMLFTIENGENLNEMSEEMKIFCEHLNKQQETDTWHIQNVSLSSVVKKGKIYHNAIVIFED